MTTYANQQPESQYASKLEAIGPQAYRLATAMVLRGMRLRGSRATDGRKGQRLKGASDGSLSPSIVEERAADIVAEAFALVCADPALRSAEPIEVLRLAEKNCQASWGSRRRPVVSLPDDFDVAEPQYDATRPWRYAYALADSQPALWHYAKRLLLDDPTLASLTPSERQSLADRLADTLPMQLLRWVASSDT